MISVECGEYNTDGIADLGEAVAIAKERGVANAVGAVSEEVIWMYYSLVSVAAYGLLGSVPGLREGSQLGGITNYVVDIRGTQPGIKEIAENVEDEIRRVAGQELPGWNPTSKIPGVRIVTMQEGAQFEEHTDDYEGLVASIQLGVDGEKTMRTEYGDTPIRSGDITLFAGDTFSPQSRTKHGFSFSGLQAMALVIGQDPFYTISGRYPFLEEHPEYFTESILRAYLGRRSI